MLAFDFDKLPTLPFSLIPPLHDNVIISIEALRRIGKPGTSGARFAIDSARALVSPAFPSGA